jgi:hypothetical protein
MAEWYLRFSYLKNIGHYPPNDPAWNDPGNPDAGIDESDEHVSEAMASMWTHFAATGDPSVPALIKWPAYDAEDPQYLEIEDPLTVNVWDCSAFAPQCYLPVPEDLSSGGLSADSMIADLLDNPDTKAVLEKHIPDNISDPRLPLFLSLRSLFALAGPDRIDQSKLPLIEADLNKLYAD